MEYRKLPHGNEKISTIGIGMGSIHESSEEEIEETINFAIDNGVNFFDMVASKEKPYKAYGKAFKGRREKVYLQMHLGASYKNGEYGWTRKLSEIKEEFSRKLDDLNTNYTDMGYIHCIDDIEDYNSMLSSGLLDYAKQLKKHGIIRHLGFSSHSPEIAKRFLDTGLVDMFMFSINPAYDYTKGTYALGSVEDRMNLYRECEKAGVGISVMKPFSGGQLLNAETSPFGRALNRYQCIKYALDRPGVLTVLPGIRGKKDLLDILKYFEVTDEEKDYSVIGEFTPQTAVGKCVYCNHCQPCPKGINIGLINKYYDLAKAGDYMAESHYHKLPLHAEDCVKCGHCESRCPFSVKQETRMYEIKTYFSK
ncbi:aldo/keto reductase [Clostridium felsineum]|uniref:aldo/keto reductase n=1 Tax=Clostridium felsineum TaxID=36839 RepID=UPI00098CB243|nr:aldo/keto reductase [Clostridium felsineum]URZ16598.1 hypothetical protein CLFE_026450 [Clostridium felsineum DSM 794]